MDTKSRLLAAAKTAGFVLLALVPPVLSFGLNTLMLQLMPLFLMMGFDPITAIDLQMLTFSSLFAVLCGLWYALAFLRKRRKASVQGNSQTPAARGRRTGSKRLRRWGLCLLASLLAAVGMQYVAYVIEQAIWALFPSVRAFQAMLSGGGGGNIRLLPILYMVILGPIGGGAGLSGDLPGLCRAGHALLVGEYPPGPAVRPAPRQPGAGGLLLSAGPASGGASAAGAAE